MLDARLIETDSYDRDAFARATRGLSRPDALLEKGERLLPHFAALVEDLFALLFKIGPRFRPAAASPASTALNRRVLLAVLNAPGFGGLREATVLDGVRATHGALDLARRVVTLIKSGELLLDEELLAAGQLAEEEERLERNRAAAEEFKSRDEELARQLAKAIEQGEARTQALTEKLERALSDVPPRFDAELASRASRLSDDLPQMEQSADSFARSVGANGPRSATERLRLAEKLEASDKLRQLARLAGAFRMEARAAKRRRARAASEVYRVGRGADPGRLLPSELTALRHALRRRDFLRRFLEEQLAQYDLRGDDRQGRGPMVVCLDGSGSMNGPRELWAKAVALALLDLARRRGRRTKAIVFSGPDAPLSTFELTGRSQLGGRRPVDLGAVVELAECFPGGGTDFEKPLRAALEAVRSTQLKGADVVFVTDGEATVPQAFAEEFNREKKKRDFEVLAVLVDDPSRNNAATEDRSALKRAARELGKVADKLTTVTQLTAASAKGVFKAL